MGLEAEGPLTSRARADLPKGPIFWLAVIAGWSIIGFGVVGGLSEANRTHPRSWAIWLVGCLVVHDFVLAPAVFTIGRVLRRSASGAVRRMLQAALVVSGVLLLLSVPVLGGLGRRADNPTLLPRNYAIGLLVALVATWICTAAVSIIAWVRRP